MPSPSRSAVAYVAGLLLLVVGCTGNAGPEVAGWFEGAPAEAALAACAEAPQMADPKPIRVELFWPKTIPSSKAQKLMESLRSYARLHGIDVKAARPHARHIPYDTLFATPYEDVKAALAEVGLDAPELGPRATRRAEKITGQVLGTELRAMLNAYSPPKRRGVAIIILDRIVAPKSAVAGSLEKVAGLTFSPFDPGDDGTGSKLGVTLGLPRHRPTVFLSIQELAQVTDSGAVVMHELGHALGLPHVTTSDNLMALNRRRDCRALLTAEQLATMRENIARLEGL